MKSALDIHVSGIVQGVGFRPFIYLLAKKNLICGWVLNSSDGVHIHAEGEDSNLDSFCISIANEAPPASSVKQVDMQESKLESYRDFKIRLSLAQGNNTEQESKTTLVSGDLSICKDCLSELFDKTHKDAKRRYRYPFINCTNCGPRFTIINSLPYDRKTTSMNQFKMCKECQREYEDPANRRFHAQPNACFICGPHLSWSSDNGKNVLWANNRDENDEIFQKCVEYIEHGKIVAIKGLGGFHLCCNANDKKAVKKSRLRKQRSNKAFAIMTNSIKNVEKIALVNKEEAELLDGVQKPIVLLKKSKNFDSYISSDVIKGLPEIGVMLPYTPVQAILLNDLAKVGIKYVVMTSGNIYDNPIVTKDKEAYRELKGVADAFVGNDREISARYDDSVVRIIKAGDSNAIQMIRWARGYAPVPIKAKFETNNEVFSTGAEQKNTMSYLRPAEDKNTDIFTSAHIGDVENLDVFTFWDETRLKLEKLFKFKPNILVRDLHSEYLTSKWAESNRSKFKHVIKLQHHFSHIASVLCENNITEPAIGFAFDGTGAGVDGAIWGGEVLIANSHDFERFANFSYIPMPGSTNCIKNPLNMAYSMLWTYELQDTKQAKEIFDDEEANTLNSIIESGVNTPHTSSLGRIFDAVSALVGVCTKPTYEGEAAILLESEIYKNADLEYKKNPRYKIDIVKNTATKNSTAHDTSVLLFDIKSMLSSILEDLSNDVETCVISLNFHNAIIEAMCNVALVANQLYCLKQVALSGGCFMNRYLIEQSIEQLTKCGFNVAINRDVPCNDGGISLGQAYVGANMINLKNNKSKK